MMLKRIAVNNIYGQTREQMLEHVLPFYLPDFAEACNDPSADVVMMHQVAFAYDQSNEEYLLLGMAIKYAGLKNKEVRIVCNKPSNDIIDSISK